MKMRSIVNFRDLGGIRAKDGSRVKEKRILRSGELFHIAQEDKEVLGEVYNLRMIVDLRAADEVEKSPDDIISGARYLHVNLMKDMQENNASRDSFFQNLQLASVDKKMKEVYGNLVTNSSAAQEYGRFLRELAALEEGACLFHCFAGKDRTGIGAALILEILGASRDDIFADYLETNRMRKEANDLACREAEKKGISGEQLEAVRQLMSVKADYLEYAYQTAEQQYGSMKSYIEKGLQIGPEVQERIRAGYLI